MKHATVALLALLVAFAPLAPTVGASSHSDGRASPSQQAYQGEHVSFEVDSELPGIRNLTIEASGETVIDVIALPGEVQDVDPRADRFRMTTDTAELTLEDHPRLPGQLDVDEGAAIEIEIADGVTVTETTDENGTRLDLAPANGPTLVLTGTLTHDDGTVTLTDDAVLHTDLASNASGEDDDSTGNETSRNQTDGEGSDQADQQADGAEDRDRATDRDDRTHRSQGSAPAHDGAYRVGALTFSLSGDQLVNLSVRSQPVLESLTVPGLRPANATHDRSELRLDGEDARVRIQADGGLLLRASSDEAVTARPSEDVDVRLEDETAFLTVGNLLLVAEGRGLSLEDGQLSADGQLRLAGRAPSHAAENATWRPHDADALTLPHTVEGRYLKFTLAEDGIENLTVHGTPIGSAEFAPIHVEEIRRTGAQIQIEAEGFELHAIDAPATRLTIEARNLTTDLPFNTTLPSGAHLHTDLGEDEVTVHVTRPAGVLANRTPVDHRPAKVPIEADRGPHPGLTTRTEGGELGVRSSQPDRLSTSFTGDLNGTEGNVSLELGLVRAMLIDDANGNGRVDVGEPALAERPLKNGTSSIEGDTLVNRFSLWSGNLTVSVEPGDETAKVTYATSNLSAPPGTLFVLETRIDAPDDASLRPTDDGVVVKNGSMTARYSAAGPVTVDGTEAWADRSVFIDSNGTVTVLLAYPAGDDIVHDPTVSIASVPGTQVVSQLAASPYAIVAGAAAAALLVGVTAWQRRRGPRP